jgi:hypothetical protein
MGTIVRAHLSVASYVRTETKSGGAWFFRLARSQRRGESQVDQMVQISRRLLPLSRRLTPALGSELLCVFLGPVGPLIQRYNVAVAVAISAD